MANVMRAGGRSYFISAARLACRGDLSLRPAGGPGVSLRAAAPLPQAGTRSQPSAPLPPASVMAEAPPRSAGLFDNFLGLFGPR